MANPPKQKGTSFETLMCNYMKQFWPNAYRPAQTGKNDTGDINGTPVPFECKNTQILALPKWTKEATREAEKANAPFCPVLHKRHGVTDPAMQWATVPAWVMAELVLAWEAHVNA